MAAKSYSAKLPNSGEIAAEQAESENLLEKTRRPSPKLKMSEDGERSYTLQLDDPSDLVALTEATGTANLGLMQNLISQQARVTLAQGTSDLEGTNASLAAMHGIKPQDELEGMLAAQMVAVHTMAMEMAKRTMIEDQTYEGVNANINRTTKLMRTFTTQIEALQKYRTKGQQKITVQHVTVADGGQAVVGDVNHQGGGDHG